MSNMDSLLDLGDSNGPPPNSPPKGGEVFDPFAPVTPTSPSQDQPGSRDPFDDFDPFSPTMSSAANGMDSGNPLYEASQNEEEYMESKLSEKERMSIEQQFDDLLGGLSESSSSNILSNGSSLASPGDVDTKTTVVTETYSGDEDEVTRVTETRTEIHDGGTTVVKTTVVEETRHEVMEPGSPSEEFEEYSHPAEAESPSPVGSPTNMESPLRSPSATSPASPTNPPVTPPGDDIRTTEVHSPSLTKSPSVSSASSAEVMIERSELEPADVHVSPTANLAQPESDHSDVEGKKKGSVTNKPILMFPRSGSLRPPSNLTATNQKKPAFIPNKPTSNRLDQLTFPKSGSLRPLQNVAKPSGGNSAGKPPGGTSMKTNTTPSSVSAKTNKPNIGSARKSKKTFPVVNGKSRLTVEFPSSGPVRPLSKKLLSMHQQKSHDGSISSEGGSKKDLKAMEYMKARYETGSSGAEKSRAKVIREPKKLEHTWASQATEQVMETEAVKKPPKEAERVVYSGLEFCKSQYESRVEKDQLAAAQTLPTRNNDDKDSSPLPPPVNKKEIEKVAPPEITQNLRAMFESGQIPDLHEAKKTRGRSPPPKDSGVYENEPERREDVVHAEDQEDESVESGKTKKLLGLWQMKQEGEEDDSKERKPIDVNEAQGPAFVENEPEVRTDVVRSGEALENETLPEEGYAKKLLKQWSTKKDEEITSKQPIKLYETEEEAGQSIYENQPEQIDENVVRSEDITEDVAAPQRGYAKNLVGFWSNKQETESSGQAKQPIQIDRSSGEPTVAENEPQLNEDVIRAIDGSMEAPLPEEGYTRNLTGFWQKKAAEDEQPKAAKEPIQIERAADPTVVAENQPAVREDVVRSTDDTENISIQRGYAKNMREQWQTMNEDNQPKQTKEQIKIDMEAAPMVSENEPEVREDVVKSGFHDKKIKLKQNNTKRMVAHWVKYDEDAHALKSQEDKPSWVLELERAKQEAEQREKEEEEERMRRYEEEQQEVDESDMIPLAKTKNMREIFLKKQEEAENVPGKNKPQLVKFTPPREMTPPPANGVAPAVNGTAFETPPPPPPEETQSSSTTLVLQS